MSLWASLRQWQFPKEFRIAACPWPQELVSQLHNLAQLIAAPPLPEDSGAAPGAPEAEDWYRALAEVGTNLWRLRQKMVQPGTNQPLEAMQRPYRHVEAIWDALKDTGVRIVDHTGERWKDGFAIKVIAFQPAKGTNFEMISETLRPTIYYQNRHIQMAEVIVSTPEPSAE
jgi:hypothetical protein